MPGPLRLALVVLAAACSGVVNSIAGGGTLLTFPALLGLGIPPLVANATSTVALWPASVSAMWGYRRDLAGVGRWAARYAVPSLLGGAAGAILLLRTPPHLFDALVPALVLGATGIFVVQRPVMAFVRRRAGARPPAGGDLPPATAALLAAQFGIGVYGGYFGAGIGILMLAALGFMGFTNIHRMNGLKSWGALCMNAVAAALFATSGLVDWPVALAMAAGSIAGGYLGAGLARRVGQAPVRAAIVVIGFAAGIWLLVVRL
ncbi:MAG TPA: sulfite exporter TauE/SafE family protein [Gemmatimonadales bacterium]